MEARTEARARGPEDRYESAPPPIIVCGPARGATTAVWGLLNSHAEIDLAREFPLARLEAFKPLIAQIDELHARWRGWGPRGAQVTRALWYSVSGEDGIPAVPVRRWGMKTPWAEEEASFYDDLVAPQYVYALRRGDRVFRSTLNMNWGAARSPLRLIARYKESLRQAERLRDEGKAHIVQLDLASDAGSRRAIVEELFAFLGEEIDAGVEEFIREWPTHWSKPTGGGELPEEWTEALAADEEYQELMARHGY